MADTSSPCGHGDKVQHTPVVNTIGKVFRRYGEAYIEQYKPGPGAIKLIRNIRKCRTPAMGATVLTCKSCGSSRWLYRSCGDSKCPICQGIKRMQCQDRISGKMLNVPYVHITFTLPHALNPLLRANKKALYGLLYRSAWATIKKVCADPRNVGGLPGMIAVMHTWGSDMKYHVHLHSIVTFGGLDDEGNWHHPHRKTKLAKYREINRVFREMYLKGLKKLLKKGALKTVAFQDEIMAEVEKKNWVVNNGQPQLDTKNIEEYLGRYVLKIAVSNSRLSLDEAKEKVKLIYNNYAGQIEGEAAPKKVKVFDPLSFIHQFLQHLPPKYFQRLRYYGLHSGATYKRIKDKLPEKLKRLGDTIRTVIQIMRALLGVEMIECEDCGGTDFEESHEMPDYEWLEKNIPNYNKRAPPDPVLPYLSRSDLELVASDLIVDGEGVCKGAEKGVEMPELA